MRAISGLKLVLSAAACSLTMACAAVAPEQLHQMSFASLGEANNPVRLAYREQGRGKPVLLIHGFGANAYTWRHLEPELARKYRVIALELKGFGQSDKPLDERYSVLDQAELVSQFIKQKDLRDVTLVGHSLGGGVALVLALQEQGKKKPRIKKIALLDSVAYAQKIPLAFNLLRAPLIGPVSSALIPKEVQAHAALRIAYHDDSKFDRTDIAEYAGPLHDKGSQHAMIYSARQIIPENIDALSARYPAIKIPALVLWCSHDKVIRPHVGWRLHNDLGNSTFHMIRGCGHIPQEERPEETARILHDFLD